jgi:hypothetical protein
VGNTLVFSLYLKGRSVHPHLRVKRRLDMSHLAP